MLKPLAYSGYFWTVQKKLDSPEHFMYMLYISCTLSMLPTLPEGEEYYTFDGEKLEHRIIGLEYVFSGKVEEEKCVEGQRYWDVVYYGDVQVSFLWPAIQYDSHCYHNYYHCWYHHCRHHLLPPPPAAATTTVDAATNTAAITTATSAVATSIVILTKIVTLQ